MSDVPSPSRSLPRRPDARPEEGEAGGGGGGSGAAIDRVKLRQQLATEFPGVPLQALDNVVTVFAEVSLGEEEEEEEEEGEGEGE